MGEYIMDIVTLAASRKYTDKKIVIATHHAPSLKKLFNNSSDISDSIKWDII